MVDPVWERDAQGWLLAVGQDLAVVAAEQAVHILGV